MKLIFTISNYKRFTCIMICGNIYFVLHKYVIKILFNFAKYNFKKCNLLLKNLKKSDCKFEKFSKKSSSLVSFRIFTTCKSKAEFYICN